VSVQCGSPHFAVLLPAAQLPRSPHRLGERLVQAAFLLGCHRPRSARRSLKPIPGPDGKTVLQLEDLKTDRSRRTLQLPAKVAEALCALRAIQAADRLRLDPHYGEMGLVFCTPAGRPMRRQRVISGFKRLCDAAGLGADWHPHEQRHTFVSVLSDAGVDIEAIADAAGDVNSSVTRTVYRHQISPVVARAAAAMDDIFGTGSA
jgi:integrase